MVGERIQRRIDALLDEADEAVSADDWKTVRQRANAALSFDAENEDAQAYLDAAAKNLDSKPAAPDAKESLPTPPVAPSWHTEQCPPPLESLILQMLRKDPSHRPESAVTRSTRCSEPSTRMRSRRATPTPTSSTNSRMASSSAGIRS